MSKRFFKATDGNVTVFRATGTRTYQSATFGTYENRDTMQWRVGGGITFSSAPAGLGSCPAVEITKSEYQALVAAKVERIKCEGGHHDDGGSPSDSWVRNSAIAGAV